MNISLTPMAFIVFVLFLIPFLYIASIKKTQINHKHGWLILTAFTSYLGLAIFLIASFCSDKKAPQQPNISG